MRKQARVETTKYRRVPELGHVELLSAFYRRHSFDRHFHDGYCFGVIEEGALGFRYLGKDFVAEPGDINLAVPGETHNGFAAADLGWRYRMFYIPSQILERAAAEVADRATGPPFFRGGVIQDPQLAAKFRLFHISLEAGNIPLLEAESRFLKILAWMIISHAEDRRVSRFSGSHVGVRRAKDYLEAHYQENISLESLSESAGLSRFHFLRVFRKQMGLPPHKYLTQLRVHHAKSLLREGSPIIDAALATGFTDQSHLNRHFKRLVGVTPGAYSNSVQD